MKPRILNSILSLLLSVFILNLYPGCSQKPHLLLITGGHDFDTAGFYSLFLSDNEISVDTVSQPAANLLIENNKAENWDAIVFYDMWQDITMAQKEAYLRLLENGTGMIFLHHSLVSYQDWNEFTAIRGGKYHEKRYGTDTSKLSGYQHDLDIKVTVIEQENPVSKGIQDFQIHDEGYYNVEILPQVTPLLQTSNPSCARYVAWTNEYQNSRIVYIMLGHDNKAYENPSFRKLISNSIDWVSQGR